MKIATEQQLLSWFAFLRTQKLPLEVSSKRWVKSRTDPQNRSLWGIAYKLLSAETGNDPEDLHEYFLGEWGGWKTIDVMGQKRRQPERRSSKLNTVEFNDFYAFIQRRSAEVGYYIPDPGEEV